MRSLCGIMCAVTMMATPAAALDYVCKVRDTGDGFISPVLALQFEPSAKTAIVYDAIIHAVHGEPISVRFKDRGNGKFRFTYRVNNIPANPRPARIGYRIELDTNTKRVIVRGSMPGVTNSFNGNGSCEVGQLKNK
ncbi:hypothetical protein FZX02_05565 [Synechococcus sp. MU1644]|nr:hypothetical protein [Synechococcus sp. MU1644]